MTWPWAAFTFVVSWWIALFAVLPLVIETPDHPAAMEYAAAPKSIRWIKLAVITTIVSIVVTAAIALLIRSGAVPLRTMIAP